MKRLAALLVGVCLAMPLPAQDRPRMAVVIDDLGDLAAAGERAIDLPGPVTCAFLPHSRHTARLARDAHAAGKEVILHQPMQAAARLSPGAGVVTLSMDETALRETVRDNLRAVPHAVGVNNHMGSLLTRHPGHMTWLMALLREEGIAYFLDSRTSKRTVAERMAREQGFGSQRRHVFLDNEAEVEAVRTQFLKLVAMAREQGRAIGIGHPYPATLEVLEQELPRLEAAGIELVPVSAVADPPQPEGAVPWHAYSPPALTGSQPSRQESAR